MSKEVICPWSGGLDSTAVVMLNLEAGNIVHAPYIEIINNAGKAIAEKNAILSLLSTPYMASRVASKQLVQFNGLITDVMSSGHSLHLKQFPVWVAGCLYSVTASTTDVNIGYVMNDDAISYLPDMIKIWESYAPLMNNLPKLTFPFSKWKKESIVDYINGLSPDIYNLTWSCEDPDKKGKACKKCPPCLRRIPETKPTRLR